MGVRRCARTGGRRLGAQHGCRDGQTGGAQVGSVPRRQRDRPVAWVLAGLPPNDASETIDGVLDLPLDNDLCARVEPWGDPSGQAAVNGTEGTDGGGFRAEEALEVRPCSHSASAGGAGASARGCVGARAEGRRVGRRDGCSQLRCRATRLWRGGPPRARGSVGADGRDDMRGAMRGD